ncbi:MAG: DNA adenine methylase, partial [Chloroflexota bacterium]
QIERPVYVEPYAGCVGAGVALLRQGLIDRLVINDLDDSAYAFWWSVTERNADLLDLVASVPLTIDEWRRQREIYRAADTSDLLKLGFAFFFLNRTNRSGILRGGVIGGLQQAGSYKIDARFNRETLINRLEALGERAQDIVVTNLDGREVIREYAPSPRTFLYVDPPYVEAGSRLYLNAFAPRDHAVLARVVREYPEANWVVTYDESSLVERLYAGSHIARYGLTYSAHKPGKVSELMIMSGPVRAAMASLGQLAAPAAGETAPVA